MAGFSDVVENKILDHIFGDGTYTVTAPVYLALTTVAVTDAMTGSTITEANYTGYARLAIAATDMNAASGGTKTNGNALTFAGCTAGSSVVVGFAICSALTGGDVIMSGSLSLTVSTTQTPVTIAVGALVASLD